MTATSWRAALDKIADLIEATVPLTTDYGLGESFTHDPAASLQAPPAVRSFCFAVDAGVTLEAASVGPFRRLKQLHCYVGYRTLGSPFELAVAIGQDADLITTSLLNQADWGESTTGLVEVGGQPDLVSWSVLEVSEGVVLLDLLIPVHHIDL